jgi:hypothetical protein
MSIEPPPLPPATFPPPPSPTKSGIPLPLIIVGVVFLGIAMLAGIAAPVILRMRKKGDQVMAMSNGKNMVLALNDFQAEYGSFPDRGTAKLVAASTRTSLDLGGDTANDYFRQLIAAGFARSEEPFWAKTAYSPYPPENHMTGNEALRAGEVGFGYVMNGDQALGSANLDQIIAVTPLFKNQTNGEFDSSPLAGKAVLVRLDSSVVFRTIRPDGKVEVGNGKTLLNTGEDTLWGVDVTPVIKPPKVR